MTDRELRDEHARASSRYERTTAEGNEFIQPPGGQRRANASLDDRKAPAVVVDLVDRMRAHLGFERPDFAPAECGDDRRDHVAEEAQDRVPWHVELRVGEGRLDHGRRRRIELEDRSV